MRRSVLCPVVFMLAMSVTGCASSPQYLYNVDSSVDFITYRTFGFFDEREQDMAAYQSVAHRHLKSAVVREMLARGYRRSENPELLVNIHIQRGDAALVPQEGGGSDYYSYRNGHYAWRAGVSTVASDYTEGTLNIDVIDPASRTLLWEGIAVGSVSQRMYESLEATIDSVVAKLFEHFPRQSPSQVSTQASTEAST